MKASISGFPELDIKERIVENKIIEEIKNQFTLSGFFDIEPRVVEPTNALLSKGETSKEIYLLTRLQEPNVDLNSPKQLGLRFDLTVPFARYIAENSGTLTYPFRRCSVGKVWRGERPQSGRFREFTQADIDIVGKIENGLDENSALPIYLDAQIVNTVDSTLNSLTKYGLPNASIHVNNRKLLQSCYDIFGVKNYEEALRIVDKLDKIGSEEVKKQLVENSESEEAAIKCVELAKITATTPNELLEKLVALLNSDSEKISEIDGYKELCVLLESTSKRVVADLKIARGLDYYTGAVFETFLDGFENMGSISSGGRYANLVSSINPKLKIPGVGMSIGVTRLLSILFDLIDVDSVAKSINPLKIFVAVNDETTRNKSDEVAKQIRENGVACVVSPSAAKFGKQIENAVKRGIKYVVFINDEDNSNENLQIKNTETGEQKDFEIEKVADFVL